MYCCEAANSFEICSLSASGKLFPAIARSLSGPAEAGLAEGGLERAGGQAGRGAGRVVAGGGGVVRGIGVEDRGQVLDLAAAGPQLPLPAAVAPDVPLLAVVVGGEQLAERPEARRLDVDHLRRPGLALDVGDRVDHR